MFATLPVTSCEPERRLSTSKRIQTYVRNTTIGQLGLNELASLNVIHDVEVTVEEINIDVESERIFR